MKPNKQNTQFMTLLCVLRLIIKVAMMKVDSLKKILSASLSIILLLFYIALWILIIAFCILADMNGMFYTFVDAWGEWSVYAGLLLALIVLLSPIFFVFLRKRYLNISICLIPALSILITIAFVFVSLTAFFVSAGRFQTFTEEKWEEYPRQRYIMLDDMKEKYGIVGMTGNQISELLGDPDEITAYQSWIYSCEYNFIEIVFNVNNQVESITLH